MRNNFSATAIFLLAALMMPTITYSATPIQIGQTNSTITSEGGCEFWRPLVEEPELVNVQYNGIDFVEYKHETGKPILLEGQEGADKNYKRIAALNVNGKEVLLEMSKAESIQCLDKNHKEKVYCESQEYANQTIRVNVKQLTNQSMSIHSEEAAVSRIISSLVTIEIGPSRTSFVVVGNCSGD